MLRVLGVPPLAAWLLAAGLFLSISRLHQHFAILAMLQAPLILSASALAVMLGSLSRWRPSDLSEHWIPLSVGVLLLIALIGAPFSVYPGRSVRYILDVYSRTLLVALMVWGVARTPRGSRFLARVFVVSGTAACLLALAIGRVDKDGRLAAGYTYDPNDLALVANVTIPLLVWWVIDKGNRARWLALMGFPILMSVIIKSNSRGGFLGLASVVLGFLILGILAGRGRLRRLSIFLAVLAVLSFPLLPVSYRERVQSLTDRTDYNLTSVSGRKQVWKRGIGYMWSRPLLGVGIDNFRTAEGRLSTVSRERSAAYVGFKWSVAHNSFVQVAAELGVIGGLTFLLLFLRAPFELLRYHQRSRLTTPVRQMDMLPPLLAISLMAFAVSGFFLSFAYHEIPYVLLGLAAAILLRGEGPAKASVRRGGSR